MIFNLSCGGGSAALNFAVKAYSSEDALPSTAKENTIAVITDAEITSWMFSHVEPASPAEGMVWILTGTTSIVEFNALKKNGIHICPLKVFQYADGAWVNKDAKSYQAGAWVAWFDGLFYDNGDPCAHLTGGWTNKGWTYGDFTVVASSIYDTHMTVRGSYGTSGQPSIVGTENKISMDNLSKIYADIDITQMGTVYLCVCKTKEVNVRAAETLAATVNAHTLNLNVSSLTGDYYIVLFATGTTGYGQNPSADITKVWGEMS